MRRYLFFTLLTFIICTSLHAQELVSRREQADRLFERAEYFKSLDLYLDLAVSDKAPVQVIERIADCYRLINNYDQAEVWYEKLSKMVGTRPVDIYFYAEALLRNKKFSQAKEMYKRYYANETDRSLVNFKLATCDSAQVWMALKGNYTIANEKKINSVYADWAPLYIDSANVLFTSDRISGEYRDYGGIYNRTGNEWLKMYNYDTKTSRISEVQFEYNRKLNLTRDYHTGPMVVTAGGDTAYVTVTSRAGKAKLSKVRTPYDEKVYVRRLELIIAKRMADGKWGKFQPFAYNDVAKYSVGHAALSTDGKLLYFTSDMPGGFGKTDIWYCQKMPDGSWSKPANCGKKINTNNDEAFPSVGGDGKLYFASKGLPGMGGYDIFSAEGSGADWNEPLNMKYPVNSTSDDIGLVTRDGKKGYLSSDRQDGAGNDDIYSFNYTGPERSAARNAMAGAPVGLSTATGANTPAAVILEGTVLNNVSGKKIDSVSVTLRNAEGVPVEGRIVGPDGKFQFKVIPGRDYTVETRRKGFFPVINHLPGRSIVPGFSAIIQLAMEPLETGKTFIIRNIYYDLNMYDIRPDAATDMENLVRVMKENPTIKIELSSHTDARGSDYYNMLLSKARANSAVNYLRRRGIAANRMTAKGYGETRLLNECANGVRCAEEDHQFNRRTEIKIIEGVR